MIKFFTIMIMLTSTKLLAVDMDQIRKDIETSTAREAIKCFEYEKQNCCKRDFDEVKKLKEFYVKYYQDIASDLTVDEDVTEDARKLRNQAQAIYNQCILNEARM